MPKEKEGHEPAKDAFDMSDEDFQGELAHARTEGPEDDTIEDDTDKGGGDTKKIEATKPPETDDTPPVVGEVTPPVETKPVDPKAGGDMPPEEDTDDWLKDNVGKEFKIKHNGQIYKVTAEKYLELAQKGYDYDSKVGPHARLVQLITSYPEIANIVNDFATSKMTGAQKTTEPESEKVKLKPLKDYENTEEWLADNVKAIEESKPKPAADKGHIDPMVDQNPERLAKLLHDHDPKGFQTVAPHLTEAFENLTIKQSKIVESSYAEFEKFYDGVKAKLMPDPSTQTPAEPTLKIEPPVTPAFHSKPGGGAPDRSTVDKSELVWDKPKDEFQAELDKAKGYG